MSDEIAKKLAADLGFAAEEPKASVPVNTGSRAYGGSTYRTSGSGYEYGRNHGEEYRSRKQGSLFDEEEEWERKAKERRAKGGRVFDETGRYVGHKVPFDDDLSVMGGSWSGPRVVAGRDVAAKSKFQEDVGKATSGVASVDGGVEMTTEQLNAVGDALVRLVGEGLEEAGFVWKSAEALEFKAMVRALVRKSLWVKGANPYSPIKEV